MASCRPARTDHRDHSASPAGCSPATAARRGENVSETKRALITVDDILHDNMRADEQILIVPGCRPIRCGRRSISAVTTCATGCSKARSPEFLRFLRQHWLKSRWWRHRRPGALPLASTGKEWTLSGHRSEAPTSELQSVVQGKGVSVSEDIGGTRTLQKKKE